MEVSALGLGLLACSPLPLKVVVGVPGEQPTGSWAASSHPSPLGIRAAFAAISKKKKKGKVKSFHVNG